jgi:hypothetical protein
MTEELFDTMRGKPMERKKLDERGMALVMALIALLIVTSIGLGMMFMADTETSINGNYRDEQTAYYAAKAGLEEARDRMRSNAGTGITINAGLPTALPGAVNGVAYILNPANSETVAPWNTADKYFDNEICKEVNCSGGQVPPTSGWYRSPALTASSTYAASPVLLYKWMRITLKTNQSASGTANVMYVNGSSSSASLNYQACWNGANEFVSSTGCTGANKPVYMLTALAITPRGTRRMVQYELTQNKTVLADAAIDTKLAQVMGDALNVTGFTDPACSGNSAYGAKSGLSITTPGQGNVTGSPSGTLPNSPFPYNVSSVISMLQGSASAIDSTGTGITGSGLPISYSGPHAVLGVAPTVTYNGSGAVTAVSAAGTPVAYYSPGNLTLGTSTLGGTAVSGQGMLLVNGNLTIDISNGFNYFGLIIVSGDITMTANSSTSSNSNIHGAIIANGKFSSNLTNLSGSIFLHYNPCFVTNGQDQSFTLISTRELMY